MMTLLQRYVARQVIQATLMVSGVIACVMLLLALLSELRHVGEGDYGLLQALEYVVMRLPGGLYQFSPLLILMGTIIGLSVLSTYREMMIMRISGFSERQAIQSTLFISLILIVMIGVLGEWLAPKLNEMAETNKQNNRNAGQVVMTSQGTWLHVKDNFIHVDHMIDRHALEGVTRYQFDSHDHLVSVYYAKKLVYHHHQWVMREGVRTNLSPARDKSEYFQEAPWDLAWNMKILDRDKADLSDLSLFKLGKAAHYLQQNGLQSDEYQYEFWQRIFQPLASLMMVFIAIPFVLSLTQRKLLGMRMMIAMIVGVIFFVLNAFLEQVCVVYQIAPLLAAILPSLLLLSISVFLVYRRRIN
jgi:lipopolysaccharide export system permease protein